MPLKLEPRIENMHTTHQIVILS